MEGRTEVGMGKKEGGVSPVADEFLAAAAKIAQLVDQGGGGPQWRGGGAELDEDHSPPGLLGFLPSPPRAPGQPSPP